MIRLASALFSLLILFGTAEAATSSYTSKGGTPVYFNTNSRPIGAINNSKPSVALCQVQSDGYGLICQTFSTGVDVVTWSDQGGNETINLDVSPTGTFGMIPAPLSPNFVRVTAD